MEIRFDGKMALVTGGGQGLGKACAMMLAENGADVFVTDVVEANARQTCEEIRALGRKSEYALMDVSSAEQVEKVFDLPERVDIVVHAAGISMNETLLDADPKRVEKLLMVNILGSSNVAQSSLRRMIPQNSGKLVFFSSIAGRQSAASMPHYRASKSAVLNLMMCTAQTAAPHNINVNAVCPGIIRTQMWEDIMTARAEQTGRDREDVWKEWAHGKIPLGRPQEPKDIANGVAFLCSDMASEITGQFLTICGGLCTGF